MKSLVVVVVETFGSPFHLVPVLAFLAVLLPSSLEADLDLASSFVVVAVVVVFAKS